MTLVVVVAVGGPFLLSLVLTYVVRAWARKIGFLDHPAAHKQHAAPVALGGGVAIIASIALPLLAGTAAAWLYRREATPPAWLPGILAAHHQGIATKFPSILSILGCAAMLHVVGLIDDRRPLGPWLKLGVQVTVALVTAGPMGIRAVEALPAGLSIAITVVWIVLVTNAFNFLDNMDGLSAGVGAIAAGIFALSAAAAGQIFVPVMAWVIVGALVGFLYFNFQPASVFMGDAGSLVIGYLMSTLTILTTFYDPRQDLSPLGVLVPVLVLAVPMYDVLSVMIHRLRLGQNPMVGDRRHFSHRLVQRGMTPRGAVLTIYLATAATGLPAVVLPRVDSVAAGLLMLQCVCVVAMIAILEHAGAKR